MTRVVLPLAIVAGLAIPPVALADQAASPPGKVATAAPTAKMDPDRIVCARERVTGSRKLRIVCMTVGEREAIRDTARRELDEGRRTLGPISGTPGSRGQN